jgi:hypothetical protein
VPKYHVPESVVTAAPMASRVMITTCKLTLEYWDVNFFLLLFVRSQLCCFCALLSRRIPHADPNWELNYTRQFFNFANDLPAFSATDDDVIMPP